VHQQEKSRKILLKNELKNLKKSSLTTTMKVETTTKLESRVFSRNKR
jgi:hypothetical protein